MSTAVLLGLILLGVYAIDCWFFPRVPHGVCKGTGRIMSPNPFSKGERDCWCDNGRRQKLGARLMGRGR